ncbi:MAG: alpha-xylosidase [Actinobacteria bacterium]|nr:alpha-xylosidase [Actinomycetota bacterium]
MDWHAGTYERARPIFDRTRRHFHPILRLESARVLAAEVQLTFETRGGAHVRGRLTFPDPEVARFQWSFGAPPGDHLSEMLVGPPPERSVRVEETDETLTVDAGGTPVVLERDPWRLHFGGFATEPADTSIVEPIAEAGGWSTDSDGRVATYETFALRPGEQLWGLGERFLGPGLRGRRLAHWIDEPFGTNTTDRLYKSVPFFASSRDYGVFLHHSEEAVFDLGATSTSSGSVLVEAGELDLFVILGQPKDVLRRYTALTGRASVPPEWSFGVWMSKCMYESREEVEEVVRTAGELDIPVDVIGLDPLWLAHRSQRSFDFCDFVWNEEDFGPLEDLVAWLHEREIRLCLWVNPHVVEGDDSFVPERLVSDGRARDPNIPERGFVDFTGVGSDWWHAEMTRLLTAGVDAFKLDYGETLPVSARLADGRTGAEAHNLYTLLASITADNAGTPVAFTRSGTAGSQRYPVHWSGDAQSTWAGMSGCLRGALALAWSGFAFWTSDIGGFYVRDLTIAEEPPDFGFSVPEDELYIRWTQFGLLCSHTRFHGTRGREPWRFGDQAIAVARDFAALRIRLRPYLIACAEEAAETGCPVMRPVALEFPDDPGARHVDTEYLLGPGLLVCPVLESGGRVEVYVPPGVWTDHFTGDRFRGPHWVSHRDVPLERLPLLVREGHKPFSS